MKNTTTLFAASIHIFVFASAPAVARFARGADQVPTERLFANVGKYVREHPNDARGHYTLGRLHALVYSAGIHPPDTLPVVIKELQTGKLVPLPGFAPLDTIRVRPPSLQGNLPEPLRSHLVASLGEYRWAVTIGPDEPLYLLGYAWMLEQAAPRAAEASEAAKESGISATPDAFRSRALSYYRRAYRLTVARELSETQGKLFNLAERSIATEAGEGILSILKTLPTKSPATRSEEDRIKREIAELARKPAYVTPIILSLQLQTSPAELLSKHEARFDLGGEGSPRLWPWPKPDTGILVWDPGHQGAIRSGCQMFGSRTWQMFWRNGYEALAALDDDGNGWLEGKELTGIAVWFDRNGNGVSNTGEVLPVTGLGITRICVRPDGVQDGAPWAGAGVELSDGRRLPTWDWTPHSIETNRAPAKSLESWN